MLDPLLDPQRLEMTERRFDVTEEDRRLRRAELPLTIGIVGAVLLMIGTGLFLAVLGVLGRQWPILGIGVGIAVVGGILTRPAYRASTVRFTEVSVGGDGVTLTMRDGRSWKAHWTDPILRLALLDYRENRHLGSMRYNSLPCHLVIPQFEVGLPVAAFDAIQEEARRQGITVQIKDTKYGARAAIVGAGPEFATPFKQV